MSRGRHDTFSSNQRTLSLVSGEERYKSQFLIFLSLIEFLELGVYSWGETKESARLAVIIVVDFKSRYRWNDIGESLLGICASTGANELDVVIEEDYVFGVFENDDNDEGSKKGRQSPTGLPFGFCHFPIG